MNIVAAQVLKIKPYSHYTTFCEDKGCEAFSSCLNCPFPKCLEEDPWGKKRFLKRKRAERMLELKREGKTLREIARICEVSRTTVCDWLRVLAKQQYSLDYSKEPWQ